MQLWNTPGLLARLVRLVEVLRGAFVLDRLARACLFVCLLCGRQRHSFHAMPCHVIGQVSDKKGARCLFACLFARFQ
ncbi:hypothetical protein IWX92DRAFT_368503 [Phyllosticta citricarpa]